MSTILINNEIKHIYSTPERLEKEKQVTTINLGNGGIKRVEKTPIWITNIHGVTTVVEKQFYDRKYRNEPNKYRLATIDEVEAELKPKVVLTTHEKEIAKQYTWNDVKDIAKERKVKIKGKTKEALMKELDLV